MRQPILYAVEAWRRQRIWPPLFIGAGVVTTAVGLLQHQAAFTDTLPMVVYLVVGVGYGLGLLLYRHRSYAQIVEGGLKVSGLRHSVVIGYDQMRWVKVQPLSNHFQSQERRRLLRPYSKSLLNKPALFVRLKAEGDELTPLIKKLGKTMSDGDLLALPVPDPESLSSELTENIPKRTSVNLGGQRRGRRRR